MTIYIWNYIAIDIDIFYYQIGDKMNRKKISTTVYITEDQNDKLKLLNKRTKVPVAEYIRQGIDMVLEKYKDQIPGQMSF